MQRSKFDIGRADAGACGMSMISSSGGASGMGASSSSSEASAMAQSTGSSGVGSGSMCLEKRSSREWSAAASVTASRKSPLWARKRCPVVHAWFLSQRSFDCASCPGRRLAPCFVHDQVVEGAVKDGAGKRGARLRLDAALKAAEDGHVAGRRASWREECEHDVRESGLHGGQGGLVGVDAGHAPEKDPRLSFLIRVQHVVQSGRGLQDRCRRCPAVL